MKGQTEASNTQTLTCRPHAHFSYQRTHAHADYTPFSSIVYFHRGWKCRVKNDKLILIVMSFARKGVRLEAAVLGNIVRVHGAA